MSRAWFSLLCLAIAAAAAPARGAQEVDVSDYDGTWSVRVPCQPRALCSARLVLSDSAGTWEELAGASLSKGACHGMKVPLTVTLLILTAVILILKKTWWARLEN